MHTNWRDRVMDVKERLGASPYYKPKSNYIKSGNEVTSSLPLQMSLYFNAMFFPVWLMCNIVILHVKFDCLSMMYQFIAVTIIIAIIVIETLRLYLGYLANLMERLPELAAFWMLSLLLQLPLQMFLLLSRHLQREPIEQTVQCVMLTLLVTQLIAGWIAMQRAVAKPLASSY